MDEVTLLSDEQILEAIKAWEPLPDILFFCDISPEIALSRNEKRNDEQDEFDKLTSLIEYNDLYNRAVKFVEKYKLTKVVRLDTTKQISELVNKIEKELKKMKG